MPLAVNLRHLEAHSIRLAGELPVGALDIDTLDEAIRLAQPLRYDLEVEKLEGGLLVQGELHLPLDCQCVRCLKQFQFALDLENWTCHLPLEGEEAVTVSNDCVDLTRYIREDILLGFPQHPVCQPECRGLLKSQINSASSSPGPEEKGSPAWDELNKLRL